jgi:hypothetical protein
LRPAFSRLHAGRSEPRDAARKHLNLNGNVGATSLRSGVGKRNVRRLFTRIL